MKKTIRVWISRDDFGSERPAERNPKIYMHEPYKNGAKGVVWYDFAEIVTLGLKPGECALFELRRVGRKGKRGIS